MDRTSAQPQVNLSWLRSKSLKFQHLNLLAGTWPTEEKSAKLLVMIFANVLCVIYFMFVKSSNTAYYEFRSCDALVTKLQRFLNLRYWSTGSDT
jgi:hypothetical protein